jgi:DNA-binding SARP family transcriptional activator
VRATRHGVRLALGPGRQRAVFALLAAHAGQVLSRDEIVEAVWGEHAPASASGNVYTYICGLRSQLEPDRPARRTGGLLASTAGGYALDIAPESVDTHRFAALRADAQRHAAAADPRAAVHAAGRALALWHGTPYAGVSGPFADRNRVRLADQRLSTVEQRARLLLLLGEDDDLIAELAGLVHEFPLHEPLHALLVQALHQRGRTAEAMTAYRQAALILRQELGVEPGRELRRLHQQLRAGDRTETVTLRRRLTPPPNPPAPATPRGRDNELAVLIGLLAGVRAGRGGAAWVEGGPGSGKTALLGAALARAGDVRVERHTADALHRRTPFATILDTLRLTLETTADHPAPQAEPVIAERLLAHVRARCAAGPLVLVVDDMHHADPASVRVWARLVAAGRRLPLLLIAAAPPAPGRRDLAHLRRAVSARPGRVLPLGLRPSVAPSAPLPPVRAGLASLLSGPALETLRAATLLDTDFTVAEIAALTGRRPHDLLPALDEALRAGVLVPAGDRLRFHDPGQRRALHDDIPAPMRTERAGARSRRPAGVRHGHPARRLLNRRAAGP